jgi:hypothetical protein
MLFKNSVRTSKRTPHFTITKINWLTLFKEMISVYPENHTKPTNTIAALPTAEAPGTYSYQSALKGYTRNLQRVLRYGAHSPQNTSLAMLYAAFMLVTMDADKWVPCGSGHSAVPPGLTLSSV